MKRVSNILNESQVILETINEKHIQEFAEYLHKRGYGFNKVMDRYARGVQWDKIDSSCVEEHDATDLKTYKVQVVKGGRFAFIKRDDKFIGIGRSTEVYSIDLNGEGNIRAIVSSRFDWATFLKDNATSYYTIDIKDYLTYSITQQRMINKSGIVLNTPEYYLQVAKENIQRYKKILAQNKLNRTDDKFREIDELVQNTINRVLRAATAYRANPEKYPGISYELDMAIESVYSTSRWDNKGHMVGNDGLLIIYKRLIGYLANIKKDGMLYSVETDMANVDNCITAIKRIVDNIDKRIQKFEQ